MNEPERNCECCFVAKGRLVTTEVEKWSHTGWLCTTCEAGLIKVILEFLHPTGR